MLILKSEVVGVGVGKASAKLQPVKQRRAEIFKRYNDQAAGYLLVIGLSPGGTRQCRRR